MRLIDGVFFFCRRREDPPAGEKAEFRRQADRRERQTNF